MKIKKRYGISILLLIVGVVAYFVISHKPIDFESTSRNGLKVSCKRGYVQVPESHAEPNAAKLEVEYVVLKSLADQPKSPIFFLAGGPGQSATGQSESPGMLNYWSSFLEERDVVLIDQRGIGGLNMFYFQLKWPDKDMLVSESTAQKHIDELSKKAIKKFNKRGINLKAFNTKDNAHDIDLIRKTLGYDKIIPLGFSYGSHLGLTYLKYHEQHVEKIILAGVEGLGDTFKMPLDLDKHFDKVNELIQQDDTLSRQMPDLQSLYQRVAGKLEKAPIELSIKTPLLIRRKIRVGKFGLDYILKRDIGDANDIPELPRMLYQLDKGDYSLFQKYVEKRFREFLVIPAMTVSMDLASGGSKERMKQIELEESQSSFGKVHNFPFLDLKKSWPINDLGAEFRNQTESDVPVLFLTGDLDVNTPSYQAAQLSEQLNNSTHLVVKNAGHEQIIYFWDVMKTMQDFMNDLNVEQTELTYRPIKFKQI